MRVLASALGRHGSRGALEDLEQGLLHAFARHVTRDRRVFALAGDLVDLVDVDDAGLRFLDVVVGGLNQLQQDVLDIFADVAGLGEGGGVGDRKRHVEHAGEGLGHQGLAAARGADQQDVGLRQLDLAIEAVPQLDALVVVVDRNGQDPLRLILADDVVVQEGVDLSGRWQLTERNVGGVGQFFFDDLVAEINALVADVDAGAGDQLLDLLLRLPAKRALQEFSTLTELGHAVAPSDFS